MVVPTICPPEPILTMLLNEHCSKRTRRTAKAVELSSVCVFNAGHIWLIDIRSIAKLCAIEIQAIIFVANPGFEEGISVRDFAGLKFTS